jgi:hypothetical protein
MFSPERGKWEGKASSGREPYAGSDRNLLGMEENAAQATDRATRCGFACDAHRKSEDLSPPRNSACRLLVVRSGG